jgi:hypothetical protein
MPVTAKLSRAFYERLGDEIANELVNWFNAVDLTYRTELRELNDLNFARFDAKVGERLAELRAELQAELRAEMDARFAKVDERFTRLEDRIRQAQVSTVKWMFVFWAGTGAMVAGWFVTKWLSP